MHLCVYIYIILCMQVSKIGRLIMAALHLLTLLSLTTIILSFAENISIDCGASETYVDSDNVTWHGDKGFVTTGKSFKIPGNVPKPFNTLRYFPSGQTNCYTNIPATRHRKTLVRTIFYYKNYDGKSSPPSFNVAYDGKHYIPVKDWYQSVFKSEVIFAPASESFSICVNRTSPSDYPFISSIQVYGLDAGMYDDLDVHEGLILRQRLAFGANKIISYPLDPYGRLWFPLRSNHKTIIELSTSAPSIDTTGVLNKPPEIVMSKALSSAYGLTFTLPLAGIPVYLALYFSEPQSLGRTQRRSFNVFLDKTQLGSGPIVPVFGNATQVVKRDIVATSQSQMVFQSTDDSVLPPIINALEVYSISNGKDSGGHGGERGGGGHGGEEGFSVYDIPDVKALVDEARKRTSPASVLKKTNKLPLILGVTVAAALSAAFAVFSCKKYHNVKPLSSTAPTTSTGSEKGISPLIGQQLASDASHTPKA